MQVVKTIVEIKQDMGNNETLTKKGVYLLADNSYFWVTLTQSGTCKKLETAMKKAKIVKA